jgi:hydrogenase nickel incorporation protein HypA/HybF
VEFLRKTITKGFNGDSLLHELTLCRQIIKILTEQLVGKEISRVVAIHLDIGKEALIEKSALSFSFEVVAAGTLMAGARLEMHDVPGDQMLIQKIEVR